MMIDKIIDLAKQDLDVYGAELGALLILEKRKGNSCGKWELMEARRRLYKLEQAITELLED